MENQFLVLNTMLGVLIALIVLLILVIIYLLTSRRLKDDISQTNNQQQLSKTPSDPLLHPNSSQNSSQVDPTTKIAEGNCHFHDELRGVGICSICGATLCESCIINHDSLNFCNEHFHLFLSNNWKVIEKVKTTPDQAHLGHYLYNFKEYLWNTLNTPSYIIVNYKINVEHDSIESDIELYGPEAETEALQKDIQKFKH